MIDATFERCFREVRTQDAPYLIGALMRSRDSGAQVWRRLTHRLEEALELFPPMGVIAMVSGVASIVEGPDFAREVRAFHEAAPLPVGQQQILQAIDVMDVNVAVAARHSATLTHELETFAGR